MTQKNTTFVKLRRGIEQHVIENKLSAVDFAVFVMLLIQADKATGKVWTCAPYLAGIFNGLSPQQAKDSLHRLKALGYLKSFQEVGSRGKYPVLIHKYEITVGTLTGCVVNALESDDYEHPRVFSQPEGTPEATPVKTPVKTPPYSRPQDLDTSIPQEEKQTRSLAPQDGLEEKDGVSSLKSIEPIAPSVAPVASAVSDTLTVTFGTGVSNSNEAPEPWRDHYTEEELAANAAMEKKRKAKATPSPGAEALARALTALDGTKYFPGDALKLEKASQAYPLETFVAAFQWGKDRKFWSDGYLSAGYLSRKRKDDGKPNYEHLIAEYKRSLAKPVTVLSGKDTGERWTLKKSAELELV